MRSREQTVAVRRYPSIFLTLLAVLLTWTSSTDVAFADRVKRKQKKEQKKQEKGAKIEQASYDPGPGWEPYFEDEDGFRMKVITPIEQNEDKDWIGLHFTDYEGPKLRLAVMEVDNRSGYHGVVSVNGIESMISTGLARTGRFDLVERERLGSLLAEQDFMASGRGARPSGAKIGQVLGAQYMVYATIVEWTPKKKSKGGGLFGVRVGKNKAEVAISVRVIDAATSQTLFTETDRATAGSWSVGFLRHRGIGGNFGIDMSSPIGYAVQSTINKLVYRLAMELKDAKWQGAVMKVDGRTVHINAGENLGMQTGYRLTCISKGEKLVDPATGLEIGHTKSAIGSLMITGVQESYSTAQIVEGCQGLKYGDFVELESTEPQQTASISP
jgi:curli biogenesis system outer membrane secretion channel CsgG